MVMARTGIFEGEVGYIDTVCTGAVLICDVEKSVSGGAFASIYSTKPQFAVSTAAMTAGVISTAAFASGDRVRFKVTQIGSTIVGKGVRFMLKCKA
jgi:translation elongation factor EF-Tu-like GTPase